MDALVVVSLVVGLIVGIGVIVGRLFGFWGWLRQRSPHSPVRALTRLRKLRPRLPWHSPREGTTVAVCVDGVRWVHDSHDYLYGERLRPECPEHLTPLRYADGRSGDVRALRSDDPLTDDPGDLGGMNWGQLYCEGTGKDDQHSIPNNGARTYRDFHHRAKALLDGQRRRARQGSDG